MFTLQMNVHFAREFLLSLANLKQKSILFLIFLAHIWVYFSKCIFTKWKCSCKVKIHFSLKNIKLDDYINYLSNCQMWCKFIRTIIWSYLPSSYEVNETHGVLTLVAYRNKGTYGNVSLFFYAQNIGAQLGMDYNVTSTVNICCSDILQFEYVKQRGINEPVPAYSTFDFHSCKSYNF